MITNSGWDVDYHWDTSMFPKHWVALPSEPKIC